MNESKKQANHCALITGGGRRIGAAIVKYLHTKGFQVAIHCHQSAEEAHALAQKLNAIRSHSAHVFIKDFSKENASRTLIEEVSQWAPTIKVLVNNASLFLKSDNNTLQSEDWQTLFKINVQVPYELSLYAFPGLAAQQGCIVNITDIHAQIPIKEYAVYCQTKAALHMQTKALAKEFAPYVRVNAVAPGAIAWPENANALSATLCEKIIAQTPLKRHGDPIYIAQAVFALVENEFITGQELAVDGGRNISSGT